MNWKELTSIDQIPQIIEESKRTDVSGVFLFKHSTRCSISLFAKKTIQADWIPELKSVIPYHLDLLNHRNVSKEIESTFGVRHESPQLILIKDGKVVFHGSHQNAKLTEVKKMCLPVK